MYPKRVLALFSSLARRSSAPLQHTGYAVEKKLTLEEYPHSMEYWYVRHLQVPNYNSNGSKRGLPFTPASSPLDFVTLAKK